MKGPILPSAGTHLHSNPAPAANIKLVALKEQFTPKPKYFLLLLLEAPKKQQRVS